MYSDFKYEEIDLKNINLDPRNPRILAPEAPKSEDEILEYLFDYEDLEKFIKKIATEGKNKGAERPYIVQNGKNYIVIEGNTRIAAYKVLTGLLTAPKKYLASTPKISRTLKSSLLKVDCSIAPSRDALLPVMANAHFGQGDKSKWGFLGSRKAVYDEWKSGRSIDNLALVFDRTEGQIRELILEWMLYQEALKLPWTKAEKERLERPGVQFNPPIRFLQSKGHKEKLGIVYDTINIKLIFQGAEAREKYQHMLKKLVVSTTRLGATSSWDEVFADYTVGRKPNTDETNVSPQNSENEHAKNSENTDKDHNKKLPPQKAGTLFTYRATVNNALISQLTKESKDLNCKRFPSSGTFLLRNIVEALLKHIIDQQKANPASTTLDLEKSLNLCASNSVTLSSEDKKILKEFLKNHLNYLNLGAHGNVIPNADRLFSARDCIDQFVKKHV